MGFFSWFPKVLKGAAPAMPGIGMSILDNGSMAGGAVSVNMDFAKLATEGYVLNSPGFSSINEIARSMSLVKVLLFAKLASGDRDELTEHPLLDLLKRPNPWQSWPEFLLEYSCHRKLGGTAYITMVGPDGGEPTELWLLRPDCVQLEDNAATGLPKRLRYTAGSQRIYELQPETGMSDIIILRGYNPLDYSRGLSELLPGAHSVDMHNASSSWNANLLRNGGKPPGVLQTEQLLNDDQRKELHESIEKKFSGAQNVGKPLVMEGGMKWQSLGMSALDMDWLNGRMQAAREIALTLGVPPLMLGLPRDGTFSNYSEARLAFVENTVLPTLNELLEALNNHLCPRFGDNLLLEADPAQLPAMKEKTTKAMQAVNTLGFLTANEKREMFGYEPVEGGDALPAAAPAAAPAEPVMTQEEQVQAVVDKLGPERAAKAAGYRLEHG